MNPRAAYHATRNCWKYKYEKMRKELESKIFVLEQHIEFSPGGKGALEALERLRKETSQE